MYLNISIDFFKVYFYSAANSGNIVPPLPSVFTGESNHNTTFQFYCR